MRSSSYLSCSFYILFSSLYNFLTKKLMAWGEENPAKDETGIMSKFADE